MTEESSVQYVSGDSGNAVAVLVPIDLWREIESERETAYLLKSETMKQRLMESLGRTGGLSLADAHKKLGMPTGLYGNFATLGQPSSHTIVEMCSREPRPAAG